MMLDGARISKHSTRQSCWIVLDSKVYDVTSFLQQHPGGESVILKQAGAVRTSLHFDRKTKKSTSKLT